MSEQEFEGVTPDQARHAAKTAAAALEEHAPGEVEALLRERESYEVRGLAERKAAVDEQLKARGYAVPVERKAPGGQTTARRRKA